jgi:hypothetical protein
MSPPDLQAFVDKNNGPSGDSKDELIADLQQELLAVTQKRHEERFLWILTLVIFADFFFLLQSNNWSAPVVIGTLEIIGLVVTAEKCGVNPIIQLLDRISPFWGKKGST